MQKIKGSYLEFSVWWRKNILLLLLFGKRRRRILFCNFGGPPQRSRQRKKASSFSSPSILGKKNFKNFPFILSKKRVGYKKNPKLFPPKRRRKICSLNFHCSKNKKKKNFLILFSERRRQKNSSLKFFSSSLSLMKVCYQ